MASTGLQILGMALSLIGWIGTIITCALPMWKVTAFIGNSIVVAQIMWEGLWMNCIVQSTGQMQCKIYDSMLALPQDLQAARALTVISILVAILGLLASIIGAKCTKCVEEENAKVKICVVSGIIFVISGVLILIPVCWSANSVIRDFYNRWWSKPKRGSWGRPCTSAGPLLPYCCSGVACCAAPAPKKKRTSLPGTPAAPSQARSNYSSKNYV